MNCTCGGASKVIDSRACPSRPGRVRRRRQCLDCRTRWTTYETRAGEPHPEAARLGNVRAMLAAADCELSGVLSGG